MRHLIEKYLKKLQSQGLASRENVIFLAQDAEIVSNRPIKDDVLRLCKVFEKMNINTILFSEPLEPYRSIINEITRYDNLCKEEKKIKPMDSETRTFFHDIPVIDEFSPDEIIRALSHRKSAIIRNKGIVTYGTVTPEQAFVSFSSTCFSTFVKYFYDSLINLENLLEGSWIDETYVENLNKIIQGLKPLPTKSNPLTMVSPKSEDDVIRMLSEAGRAVVNYGLVDSYFGNISYIYNSKIYISQTGSSLDELECSIEAVPLDGSSSVGITASTELPTHKGIYEETGDNAILHGHPKFSVIMSLYCEKRDCNQYHLRDLCHKYCKQDRYIRDIPIVSGEIGTGPTGLVNRVPKKMKEVRGVIVYGHGVFTSGRDNFQRPFNMLMNIENICLEEYLNTMKETLYGTII